MLRLKIGNTQQYYSIKKKMEEGKELLASKPKDVAEQAQHESIKKLVRMYQDALEVYEHRNDKWQQHGE